MDDIVRREQGSAVTNLRIEASNYSSGDHGSAASFKIGGWILGASGVTAIAAGAAQSDATNQSGLFTLGGIFLGAGALALLLSATAKKPASWQFTVSGQVVKSRAPVPAASNTSAQLH